MARFSIVVPAYNASATLAETLDAVLSQDFDDWECVVVDDGSMDETLSIAQAYAERDRRLRVVSQENRGSAGAYNTGVREAGGELVVLCSADDILLVEHLASMADFVDSNPGFAIFSTNGYYLKPDGTRELVYTSGEIKDSLTLADVIRNCFYSVGATYRRGLFESVGGYRTDVFGEDYDFWLRAMAGGARHRYLARPLSLHRLSETQKSANVEKAFLSDIRLVTDLRDAYDLTPEELAEVDEVVRVREQRIALLRGESPASGLKARGSATAVRVFGARRVRRILATIRSTFSSGKPDAG